MARVATAAGLEAAAPRDQTKAALAAQGERAEVVLAGKVARLEFAEAARAAAAATPRRVSRASPPRPPSGSTMERISSTRGPRRRGSRRWRRRSRRAAPPFGLSATPTVWGRIGATWRSLRRAPTPPSPPLLHKALIPVSLSLSAGATNRRSPRKTAGQPSQPPGCLRSDRSSGAGALKFSAKVMLLGDIGVGNSSLAKRLMFDRFDADYKTTMAWTS